MIVQELSPDEELPFGIKPQPGYSGVFTTEQAAGALGNGTRVRKNVSEKGDAHSDGSLGTVLGSVSHPEAGIAYFIEWDAKPRWAVLTVAWKVVADAPR